MPLRSLLLTLCSALISFCLAASAFAATPRPEFPDPQFERQDWLSLNGEWQFGFDDADAGMDARWYAGDHVFARKVIVPFCFESSLSGVGDTAFHPWAWYRREVNLPESWLPRRTLLHFGAVDYQASVWVNGQLAGSHEGGNTPFSFDVTSLLKPGANTIAVRAWDPPEDKLIPRGKQYWELKSKDIFYSRTSGIWQSVWIEAAGAAYLDHIHIAPDPMGDVNFNATFAHSHDGDSMQVSIFDGESEISRGTAPIAQNRAVLPLRVIHQHLWSVEDPKLYNVTVETWRNDQMIDRVRSYFGFRTVQARDGRVWLNGKPVYLKFVLDQGYWPESNLTPPTDEAIQYDIRMTKEMGFNGARKHQKVEDPRFLYWADKMGFLVSGEMANAQGFDEQYAARFNREWMEAVERDINHPSIVIWAPLNESWGVPDLRDQRQQMHLKELYALTRTLDNSRLVIDNEGWQHTDQTDLFAIHDYTRNGALLWERYRDLGRKPVRIPDNGRPSLISGYEYNGSPVYLSEFGGIAYIPQGLNAPLLAWGYSGVEKSEQDAFDRLEGIYQAIAHIPEITGICYTQLTDVEQEVNGLMTYDRKPKFDVKKIKALNDLLQ